MARKRMANFTEKELKDLLCVSKNEQHLYIPNEIFNDLAMKAHEGIFGSERSRSTHVAYAFAYYWLAQYLYRYAKLENQNGVEITEAIMKRILGFQGNAEAYTYITKNKGVLEQMEYITKVSDYPLRYHYIREIMGMFGKIEGIEFTFYSELVEDGFMAKENRKNRKVNEILKGTYRTKESEDEKINDGLWTEINNTTLIDFDVFSYCMANKEIGVEGFYLYCFLKYNTEKFPDGFDCSHGGFMRGTGLKEGMIKEQLVKLEERNMIERKRKPMCKMNEVPEGLKTKADTYYVKEYIEFARDIWGFNKIPKGQMWLGAEEYQRQIGFVGGELVSGDLEVLNKTTNPFNYL